MPKLLKKVMYYISKIYFPVFAILAIIIYMAQYFAIGLPLFVNNHLNDFLCMPIVLLICQTAVRYIKSDITLRIPFSLLVLITVIFTIYFEYYLPSVNDRYTADVFDVLMYFSGLLFFYLMENGYGNRNRNQLTEF